MLHRIGLAAALLLAVGRLFLVNGVSIGAFLIFLAAPAMAYLVAIRAPRPTSLVAESFLSLIGVGVILASFDLLPPVFNNFPKLPRTDNRFLSFHLAVYMFYGVGVVPPYALLRSLWHHRRGEPAELAPFICWLGLATWALCMAIAVGAFVHWLNGGFERR